MKKSHKTKKTAGLFERVTSIFRKNDRPSNVVSSKDNVTDSSDYPCPLYGPPPWMKESEKDRKYDDGLIDATAEFARKHGVELIDHIPKKKHPRPPKKDKDGKFIPE